MTYEEKILQEFAKILPAQDHYSGTHIYKERRMKLSEEEIKTMYYFLKDALAKMITPEQHQKTIDIALAKYKAELLAEVEREVIGEADSYTRKIVNNTYAKQLELRRLIELVQQQRQKLSELKGKNE